MSAATHLMEEALLVKGRRFRVVRPGARIVGMRSIGSYAWQSDFHELKVGDIVTCLGPVRRLGSDPGPDTIGWSAPSMGTGWSMPEFSPAGTPRFWGPTIPEEGFLEPSRAQAAEDRLAALVRRALDQAGLLAPNPAIDETSRVLIQAVREEHGEAWLGQVSGPPTDGPILVRWAGNAGGEPPCSFVLPSHDAEVEQWIREYRRAPPRDAWENTVRVSYILRRVKSAGGASLFWTISRDERTKTADGR